MAKRETTREAVDRIRREQADDSGKTRCDECPTDGQCKACREIDTLFIELRLYGFAAAKRIAQLRRLTSGEMECPLCQQTLRFSIAPSNGHMAAKCETLKCINAME